MTSDAQAKATTANGPASAWSPFGRPAFAVLWIATVLSNIGTWMHDVGAGWLMTELSPSPFIVATVQAATTLPVFLFALPAGAIADIVDRRRLLIVVNAFMALTAGALALLVSTALITPVTLVIFTFLLGTGAAFMAPAWQAIVPSLVPKPQLSAAVALNSMGINVSRAIGPALAGLLIVAVGLAAPFAVNALSFIGIIAALLWWRPARPKESALPPEHVLSAMATGLRYATNSAPLKATLIRALAFFLFASALWALLPLIARELLNGGATLYGYLLASIGIGAVLGALVMPAVKSRLGPDRTVAAGTVGIALALILLATVAHPAVAIAAAALSGLSWIAVLSSLHVSAQTALPNWVRARGLSIFLTIFFGAMALGSLVWGQLASMTSIATSLLIAAGGALILIPLTWRAKLNQGEAMDLAPSMHWPAPLLADEASTDHGPVMVQVAYAIEAADRDAFFSLMDELAAARRRSGAHGWTLMEDAADPTRLIETWYEASWTDHLRHHERVTGADQAIQDAIRRLQRASEPPVVTHMLTADRERTIETEVRDGPKKQSPMEGYKDELEPGN